ncbi:MAG: glycosyltransferase [Geminicoccaceae bacterium]|nr:glycosyltransferase [Geminicoccaceae bacterium]
MSQRPADSEPARGCGPSQTTSEADKVAICVCTYRRPQGLGRLLLGLAALRFPTVAPPPEISIVLADNDPAGSGAEVVATMRHEVPWPIVYVHEPRRGLSFVRNATLDAVPDDARWIAFIDDDEEPTPDWLDALLATARAYDAPIVAGPVRPVFQEEPASWVVEGGFFRLGPYVDGGIPPTISTNNALIEAVHIRRAGWRFDPAFNLTGGEDQHFFSRAVAAGLTAVTSADAEVVETVPPSRTTLRWLLRRHFRMGTTLATIDLMRRRSIGSVMVRAGKGAARMGLGAVQLIGALGGGRARAAAAACNVAWGAGSLAGLLGLGYQEYGPGRLAKLPRRSET